MQYAISLGLSLLPFVITIIVCIVLRKILIRVLGEKHQVNSYILVIVPFMAVLLAGYVVCRPLFLGERSYTVLPDQLNAAAKGYTIDEAWRKGGVNTIQPGDLIVFRAGSKEAFNKSSTVPNLYAGRVIGMPGQRLQSHLVAGNNTTNRFVLHIDGQKAPTALDNTQFYGINDLHFGLTVPADSLWVTSDFGARRGIQDFDSPYVGPIRASQVVGVIHAWGQTDVIDMMDDTKKK